MSERRDKYIVDGVDVFMVRNRNESRVTECMREVLDTMKDKYFSEKALRDIYAYSLNQIPARYTQSGTIVLRDPVRKDAVRKIVRKAFDVVTNNPKE